MNCRLNRSLVSVLALLFVLGAASAWAWYRVTAVPEHLRAKMNLLEALQFKNTCQTNPPTPEQIAAQHQAALALKDRLAAEFPALKITPRPVPDAQNAYLLLYQLAGPGNPSINRLPISEEFRKILSGLGTDPWDPEIAKRHLTEHAGLIDQLEHIAALSTRSSSNLPADYQGFVSGIPGKTGCDILLLKARLAADAGNEDEALRLVTAAGNMGTHYHEVEGPTLLGETVAILTTLATDHTVLKTLLPALGRKADLGRWKTALGHRTFSTAELAQVLRGEWNTGAEYLFFPFLLAAASNHQLPDAEAVARASTAWFNTCVTRLPTCGLTDVNRVLQPPADVSHLSKEGREILDDLVSETPIWTQGYVSAAARHAQYQAAMDLLILEQGGVTLTAADAARVTHDPVSGAPFVFDAAKRVLTAPPASDTPELLPLAFPW